MLGNFHAFLSSADFFQSKLFEKLLSGIPSECKQFDQAQHRPDLGPNCLPIGRQYKELKREERNSDYSIILPCSFYIQNFKIASLHVCRHASWFCY